MTDEFKNRVYKTAMERLEKNKKYLSCMKLRDPESRFWEDLEDAKDASGGCICDMHKIVAKNYCKLTPFKLNQIFDEYSGIVMKHKLEPTKEETVNFLTFQMYSCLMELENAKLDGEKYASHIVALNINCKEYLKIVGKISPLRYIGEIHDSDKHFKIGVEVFVIYNRGKKINDMIKIYKKIEDLGVEMPWFSESFEFKHNRLFVVEYMNTPKYKELSREEKLEIILNITNILKLINRKNIFLNVKPEDIGEVNYEKNNYKYIIKKFNMGIVENGEEIKTQFYNLLKSFGENSLANFIEKYEGDFIHDDLIEKVILKKREIIFSKD